MRSVLLLALAACAAVTSTAADAAPRKSRHHDGMDIVVHRRSPFDAGVKVKPGTTGDLNYVAASQGHTPAYQHISSQFGGETLPQRGELPGCCGVKTGFWN